MGDSPATYLLSPRSLQNILTNACRSGKETPVEVAVPMAMHNHADENGSSSTPPTSAPAAPPHPTQGILPPPSEGPRGSIRQAVLMTREGNLMCQSEGMDAEAAAFISGLVSNVWRSQLAAAAGAEPIQESSEGKEGNAAQKTVLGELDYVLMIHKDKSIAIAPSFIYLVCLIADREVQIGYLKNRVLRLAKRLKGAMEDVTPKCFLE